MWLGSRPGLIPPPPPVPPVHQATLKSVGVTTSELLSRYHLVLHLVTAADGAQEFYTLANNSARTEDARGGWVSPDHAGEGAGGAGGGDFSCCVDRGGWRAIL
jgi:hypothetical protein